MLKFILGVLCGGDPGSCSNIVTSFKELPMPIQEAFKEAVNGYLRAASIDEVVDFILDSGRPDLTPELESNRPKLEMILSTRHYIKCLVEYLRSLA